MSRITKRGPRFDKTLGLLAFAVGCVLSVWIWRPGPDPVPIAAPTPARSLQAQVEGARDQMAELIPLTVDRPLFHATRKPLPESAAPVLPAAQAPNVTPTLVGVIGDKDNWIALLRVPNSSELYQLGVGDEIGDWRVLAVGDDFVRIGADGESPIVLSIDE